MVEARSPATLEGAGAFRRDHKRQFIGSLEGGRNLVDIFSALRPVDRHTAHVEHEVGHRPFEQGVLAHKTGLHPEMVHPAEEEHKIPVRRMRRAGDDAFADTGMAPFDLPALPAIERQQRPPRDA